MALSWPDALSAYHTTAIPNIEAYMEVGAAGSVLAPLTARIGEAFQLPILRSALRLSAGPSRKALPRRRGGLRIQSLWQRRRTPGGA